MLTPAISAICSLMRQPESRPVDDFSRREYSTNQYVEDFFASDLADAERRYEQASRKYGGMEALACGSRAPAAGIWTRRRRHAAAVPREGVASSSVSPDFDHVEIVQLANVSVKKSYSTFDILRAISSARAPFNYSAAMAMDLYSVASGETVDPGRRELLLSFAELFDSIASLDPRIMLVQGFGDAARMAADVLEDKKLTAEDMLNLMNIFKVAMTMRRFSQDSVVRMRKMTEKAMANANGGAVWSHARPPVFVPAAPGPRRSLGQQGVGRSISWITYGYFNALGSRLTVVPERLRPPSLPAMKPVADVARQPGQSGIPAEAVEKILSESPVKRPIRPIDMHAQREGTVAVDFLVPLQESGAAKEKREFAIGGGNEVARDTGESGATRTRAMPEESVKNGDDERGAEPDAENDEIEAGSFEEYVREGELEQYDVRFFDLAYAESLVPDLDVGTERHPARMNGQDSVVADLAIAATDTAISVARPRYAMTSGIRLRPEMDGHTFVRWHTMPMEKYRVEGLVGPDEPGIFYADHIAYAQFGEHCYAVRDVGRDDWHIVSRKDSAMPPIPLVRNGEEYIVRTAVPAVFAGEEPQAIADRQASDGFVRYHNKKYVLVDGMLVSVDRSNIVGEQSVAALAIAIADYVGPADAMGIIDIAEYGAVIEGAHGYYRLSQDSELQKFFVSGDRGERQAEVEFDIDTGLWRIVENGTGIALNEAAQGQSAMSSMTADRSEASSLEPRLGALPAGGEGAQTLEVAPEERSASIAPARKWSVDSVTSLEYYRSESASMAFMARRPALRQAIDKAFKALIDANLLRSNRVDVVGGSDAYAVPFAIPIGEMRSALFSYMPGEKTWRKMTIRQKQKAAAEAAFQVYLADAGRWFFFEPTAFCHEMVDMTLWYFANARGIKKKVLEITFRDLSGSGMRHVALLYSEFPQLLERFGDMQSIKSEVHVSRPTLGRQEFEQFLFDHRGEVILIDPWASKKLSDFTRVTELAEVQGPIQANLQEAKFSTELELKYEVRAVLPDRIAKPRH